MFLCTAVHCDGGARRSPESVEEKKNFIQPDTFWETKTTAHFVTVYFSSQTLFEQPNNTAENTVQMIKHKRTHDVGGECKNPTELYGGTFVLLTMNKHFTPKFAIFIKIQTHRSAG